MKRIYPHIEYETIEEQSAASRYNAARKFKHGLNWYLLTAGRNDDMYFWSGGGYIYVLNINFSYYYVGLDVYEVKKEKYDLLIESCRGHFIQEHCDYELEVKNVLNNRSAAWLKNRLLEHIEL